MEESRLDTHRRDLAWLASADTLRSAWDHVRRRRAHGGLDRVTVEDFDRGASRYLDRLRVDLLEQRYAPEPALDVAIPKPSHPGEIRTLALPSVRDKIVQEAVRHLVERRAEPQFLDCSYGYRPGKGPVKAIGRVTHQLTSLHHEWIARADIDNFFPSIPHAPLLDAVRKLGVDEAIIRLIELWLRMGHVDTRGRWHDADLGLAQGTGLSPLLANLYLQPFDQSMTDRGVALVRYADDFLITATDDTTARGGYDTAERFLSERLKLRLNANPAPVVRAFDGFSFLGVRFEGGRLTIDHDKLRSIDAALAAAATRPTTAAVAVNEVSEMTAGWRRYYATVVDEAATTDLAERVTKGLTEILAVRIQRGEIRSKSAANEALAHVETLMPSDARRTWMTHMVDEAWRLADARQTDKSGSSSAAQSRRRPPTASRPPVLPAVTAVVRKRKRRHLVDEADRTDLLIETPGTFVGRSRDRIVVRRDRRTLCDLLPKNVRTITVVSHGVSLSTDLVNLCVERRIPLLFVDGIGHTTAVLASATAPTDATLAGQIACAADPGPAIQLAKSFVFAKIANQAAFVKSLTKYRGRRQAEFYERALRCLDTVAALKRELRALPPGDAIETVRGRLLSIEGRAAQSYWDALGILFAGRVPFPGRVRHGAADPVNSLLNYGYAILQARVHLALVRAGLLPQLGCLHAGRRDNPVLSYDLMEVFRAPVVDRAVLAMVDRREPCAVDAEGRLDGATRARIILRVRRRLATLVRAEGHDRTIEALIGRQAEAVARHFRGEERYRPFLARW